MVQSHSRLSKQILNKGGGNMFRPIYHHNYTRLGGIVGLLLTIIVVIGGAIGYGLNINALIHIINNPITGMCILRFIGIFAFPLGCILGYF
jgi:hypothetical protein